MVGVYGKRERERVQALRKNALCDLYFTKLLIVKFYHLPVVPAWGPRLTSWALGDI